MIFSTPNAKHLSILLAKKLNLEFQLVGDRIHPDGEINLNLPSRPKRAVVVMGGYPNPHREIFLFNLICQSLRSIGVKSIIGVVLYLPYARSSDGPPPESIASKIVASSINQSSCDRLIVVAPHDLAATKTIVAPLEIINLIDWVSPFLKETHFDYFIGADHGIDSELHILSNKFNVQHYVFNKTRDHEGNPHIFVPNLDFTGQSLLIVDDMVSTGKTIQAAVNICKQLHAKQITVAATHLLNANLTAQSLGISHLLSSNSISHNDSAAIDLSDIIAKRLD